MKFKYLVALVVVGLTATTTTAAIATASNDDGRHGMAIQVGTAVPTGSEQADYHLVKAVDRLEDAADLAATGSIAKAVEKDGDAVKYLLEATEELGGSGATRLIDGVIGEIVATDSVLAHEAIDAAVAVGAQGKYLAKAQGHAATADALVATDVEKAVDEYAKAIEYAGKANAKGASTTTTTTTTTTMAPQFSGKYSEYTFWFANLETGALTGPVSGSNHPDSEFGSTESYKIGLLDIAGVVMTLNVSCSDKFKDGVGHKADPEADSPWRVIGYQIEKYKNGKAAKSCEGQPIVVPGPAAAPALSIDTTYRVNGGGWTQSTVIRPSWVFDTDVLDFRFQVANTGNVSLSSISIIDDLVATAQVPTCSAAVLDPGATMECVVGGVSLPLGPHMNTTTVSGHLVSLMITSNDAVSLNVISR